MHGHVQEFFKGRLLSVRWTSRVSRWRKWIFQHRRIRSMIMHDRCMSLLFTWMHSSGSFSFVLRYTGCSPVWCSSSKQISRLLYSLLSSSKGFFEIMLGSLFLSHFSTLFLFHALVILTSPLLVYPFLFYPSLFFPALDFAWCFLPSQLSDCLIPKRRLYRIIPPLFDVQGLHRPVSSTIVSRPLLKYHKWLKTLCTTLYHKLFQ